MGNAQGGPPPNPQGEEKKEDEPKKKVSVVLGMITRAIIEIDALFETYYSNYWPTLEIQPRDGCPRRPETQEEGSGHWRKAP